MCLVIEGNEPKGLDAARFRFHFYLQKFGHSVNRTLACLECDLHKFTLIKGLWQDQ